MAFRQSEIIVGDKGDFAGGSKRGAILVPMNSSDRAWSAASRAFELARRFRLPVRLESYLPADATPNDGNAAFQLLRDTIRNQKGKMPAAVAIGVRLVADYWDDEEYGVAQSIIDAAAETKTTLIVLGVHSRRKLFSLTMTQKLMLDAVTPVLIATTGEARQWRRVIVAVDFSNWSARAVEFASVWAADAEIHIVHALDARIEQTKDDARLQDQVARFESDIKLLTKSSFGDVNRGAVGEMKILHHIAAGSVRDVQSGR